MTGAQPVAQLSGNVTTAIAVTSPWPQIKEFKASSENITPGENVTLTWEVTGGGTVTIDSGIGKVQPAGTKQVLPQKTTKYTLTVTGEKGVSTAWVTVKVAEKITLMPDLAITGITYNSGLLYYTIKNIGGADAGPSDTYLWDQSNMWRDTSWVNGLKAGEEKTQPFTNFNYHGDKITVCADGGKVITEANEENNCFIPTFGFKFNYDFQQYASRATWRGSAGRPDFGLTGGSSLGLVTKLSSVIAEDGNSYRNVIEMVPAPESYAWLEGVFGDWQEQWQAGGYMLPIELPNNSRFTAKIGLSKEAEGSSGVTFLFGLMNANGSINWWPAVKAGYDGTLQSMDIDLSSYNNIKVMAILRVESGADMDKNYALWIEPRISQ
ncbi:MAG: hypothetical protein NTZ34_11090 [Chloroflexi bacterium]|nr:hypothetical protein [Chloroflexota bacterium]